MTKRTKKLLAMLLSASFLIGLAAPAQTMGTVKAAEDKAGTDIYPKVQSMTEDSEDGMKFDGTVDLVMHGDQIEAMDIAEILEAEGIEYRTADEVTEGNATIFITSDADHCEACGAAFGDEQALAEEQGYVLKTSDADNSKGAVTIIGADAEGAFYGVKSLEQLFEQKNSAGKIAEVTVSDWPDIKLRGFVEGFYGYPWTYEDRLSLMQDSGKFKMNTYIYAPKDDPYHRHQWRDLYPEEEAENIRKLAEAGRESNVNFCWSIHPGDGFNYNNDDDFNAMIAKLEQLYDLGVRQFGISYDDLGSQADYSRGQVHAETINRVNEEFVKVKGDVKPLITVAVRYNNAWGPGMYNYFTPYMQTLDDDVINMWTGNGTMSVVNKAAFEWPKNQTGVDKDQACWWNYPVNDYCDGKMLMAPLETVYNDVDNLKGFFLNPMSWAEASKVAIFSGADYSWNVGDFEYMPSWERAIEELVPDVSEAFERFADNISYLKDGFEFDESRYLTDKISALNSAISSGEGIVEAAEALKAEFELMREDVVAMNNMENRDMYDDVKVHLEAYDVLAAAGVDGMSALLAATEGDVGTCLDKLESMQANLDHMADFTVTSLEDGGTKTNIVDVGVKRIKPMLEGLETQVQAVLKAEISPEINAKVVTNVEALAETEVVLAQGNYSISGIAADFAAEDYVGFMLPKAMKLSKIEVTGSDSWTLETSLNGITWTAAEATATDTGLVYEEITDAAFVRVVNKGEAQALTVDELKVYPIYDTETNPTVSTDLSVYQWYYIENAMDGDMNSKFYSSSGASAGSFVKVDLGKNIPIYDTTIYYAANPKGIAEGVDGFHTTKFEISADGATWTQVGEPIVYTDYTVLNDTLNRCSVEFNAEGQIARYLRFSTTESYDNWVQIYEIEYNKTATNLGDDVVQLVDSTMEIVGAPSLYDGDMATAPTIPQPADGDSLTYKLTTVTNVSTIAMLQDKEAISNAKVEVQNLEGTWIEIGTFDSYYQVFDVDAQVTALRLTFDGSVVPVIYEVFVNEGEPIVPVAFDATILAENAMANSEMNPADGNDGPAAWAFNEEENWWHSRWGAWDQKGDHEIGEEKGGKPSDDNPIWIQTGFDKEWMVDSVTYVGRSNKMGLIGKYELAVADLDDPTATPTDDDFTVVKSGSLEITTDVQTIKLDKAVKATHVRLTAYQAYALTDGADGDGHVAAQNIKIYGYEVRCDHEETALEGVVEATCTTDGYTGDTVCTACGKVIREGRVIPAAHTWGEWVVTVEPTETEEGSKERTCEVCGEKETEVLPVVVIKTEIPVDAMTVSAGDSQSGEGPEMAVDGNSDTMWHTDWYAGDNHDNHWFQIELDGMYMVDGFKYLPRQVQTNGIITKYIIQTSADGETWEEIASGDWAGDSAEKVVDFEAVKTKYIRLQPVEALSDQELKFACAAEIRLTGEKVVCTEHTLETVAGKDATCTEDGYTESKVCSNCGHVDTEAEVIEALGHSWGEAVETAATCTEAGSKVTTCETCGETDEETIPALGHTWGEWVVTAEPTETEEGSKERECTVCGEKEADTIDKLPMDNPFVDVTEADYFYNAVLWAVRNDVTAGITPTTFEPYTECNRAQIVLFLYRALNGEAVDTENPFTDVSEADYCYDAVLWAVENGITTGITATTFEPWKACTRAEIVTFLWRAMGSEKVAADKVFDDVNTADFFYDAVAWAVENSVTTGLNDKSFGAWSNCFRGDAVTFIQRAVAE